MNSFIQIEIVIARISFVYDLIVVLNCLIIAFTLRRWDFVIIPSKQSSENFCRSFGLVQILTKTHLIGINHE